MGPAVAARLLNQRRRFVLLLLVCVSLAVKIAGVAYMNRHLSWNLVAPDTRGVYRPLAINLVEGRGYQLEGDFRDATRVAPGFPVYLAAIYRVWGTDPPVWWLGVLNAAMRGVVTALVYLLALRAFGPRAAAAAAAIHALDPWEAFWTPFVLKESLAVLVSVLAVYAVVRVLERPTWAGSLLAGAAIAVAALTRYASLGLFLWAVALTTLGAIGRLIPARTALRLVAGATIGLLAALAPWLVRNDRLFGTPLMYTQAGFYLYVSNGPGTERAPDTWGYSGRSPIDRSRVNDIAGRHRAAADRDAAFLLEAVRHVATHPRAAAEVAAARVVNMWRPTFEGSSTPNLLLLGVPYGLITVAALVGVVLAVRGGAGRQDAPLALLSLVAFYVLLHLVFWSEIRYRQYVTPFLDVFAGYAASAVGQPATRKWRGGR